MSTLSPAGILRVPATEAATGYKRASLYRLEREGKFPRRVKLGQGQGGAVGWRASEVRAWVDARAAGLDWTPATAMPHPATPPARNLAAG